MAHSFKGELFGPAQALHGITYVVDAVIKGPKLLPGANYLVDICVAERALHAALARYDLTNLDDLDEFAGDNTTCERVARAVWEQVAAALPGPPELDALQIIVKESDVAHIEYERLLGPGSAPAAFYTVSVRSRFMAARSLASAGAAARGPLHGATFVVDALFSGHELDERATILFDICLGAELLQAAVAPLHQSNLDGNAALGGRRNPTANAIAEALWESVAGGLPARHALTHLKIVVREHDEAAAEYARSLGGVGGAAHTLVARGRCMIAHSLTGEAFGPAQALHGCTYVVDARYSAPTLTCACSVCERADAEAALRGALALYTQRNLDDLAEFAQENTTCERVARALWARVAAALSARSRGAIDGIEIVVRESDVAWVSFRRALGPPTPAGGATVALDLDSLAGGGDADTLASGTPTGIVHRSPLGELAAAMPHPLAVVSAKAPVDARVAMERLGLGVASHCLRLHSPTELRWDDPALTLRVLTASAETKRLAAQGGGGAAAAAAPLVTACCTADRALLASVGCTSARDDGGAARAAYLSAKLPIDQAAYNPAVSRALDVSLAELYAAGAAGTAALRVFDLGAGTLSMLPLLEGATRRTGWPSLHYYAFDLDASLLDASARSLIAGGTHVASQRAAPPLQASGGGRARAAAHCLESRTAAGGAAAAGPFTLLGLFVADVLELEKLEYAPCDLIVGCGFADLMPPAQLATLLPRLCPGGLAYLPITFSGTTRLEPPCAGAGHVPSDAELTGAYHAHLAAQGQHLEPQLLVEEVRAAGGGIVASGASQWRVGPADPFHTWMVDFLAGGAARAMWAGGWDAAAWRARVLHERRATIVAENLDLLLRLPPAHSAPRLAAGPSYAALRFVAPRRVEVVQQHFPPSVAAGGVALRSVVSMVSAGTELFIFRGDFDESDEPLDASIEGMSGERLRYPMAYGYSMVGRVAAVGAGVPTAAVGTLVFAFAPHAAFAFVDAAGTRPVPAGISAADAAFLPAAETAISIAHDAHPRVAETVHVVGCGIIGLLVVAALQAAGTRVVAIEPEAPRRALAIRLGAAAAFDPSHAPRRAADVSVECSGSPAALQGAIDGTRDCGRVVVASWYGKKPVALSLGTRFHRSHLELIASQVSAITGPHASRWSKERRFDAAWGLIRRLKPATSLPVLAMPLARAAEAYELLDRCGAAAVHLDYT